MHILHIVRDLDKTSGGPSRSVPSLVENLGDVNIDGTVLFADRGHETTVSNANTNADYVSFRRYVVPWQAFRDSRELSALHAQHAIDIVHSHGLWCGLNHSAARFAKRHGVPLIITPRGMLEPWSLRQKRFKKQIAMWLYQRTDLNLANVLHATCEAEALQLRSLGFNGEIAVIPNGTEFPENTPSASPASQTRRMLFLSRLHPKKGIDNLIRAWATLAPVGWECVVTGPDEDGYLAELKQLHRSLGSVDSLRFHDAVDGDAKWNLMSSADVFVLPSHTENFGIVVAESLACGVPVITTKNTPWQDLEEHNCGWWIEDNLAALTEALKTTLAMSREELATRGRRGRTLVEERYTWKSVAQKMRGVYTSVLDGS